MNPETLKHIFGENQLPLAQAYNVLERLTGMHIGDNVTIQFTHSLTERVMQCTFDAKHRLSSQQKTLWHYNKPLKFLHLNKNKSNRILILYANGDIGTCSQTCIKKIWDGNCSGIDCSKPIIFIEEARHFVRDLFGAFFAHNIASRFCENPALLILVQVFHTCKEKTILSVARHNALKLKDLISSTFFESVEQQLEKNINIKNDLLEDYSRDLVGIPIIENFELIYDEFAVERNFPKRDWRDRKYVDYHGTILKGFERGHSSFTPDFASESKNISSTFQTPGTTFEKSLVLPTRARIVRQQNAFSDRNKPINTSKNHRYTSVVKPSDVLTVFFDRQSFWLQSIFLKKSVLLKHYPTRIHLPPKSVKLTRLNTNSRYIRSIPHKMSLTEYTKMALANMSKLLPKTILKPDYCESSIIRTKNYSVHCIVCGLKNKHKTRRKPWICSRCKTPYTGVVVKQRRINNLKNIPDDNVCVYTDSRMTVAPSPLKSAHCPRTMCDALRRELTDAEHDSAFKNFVPTICDLKKLKEKILSSKAKQILLEKKKSGFKRRTEAENNPYYRYKCEIPIVHGSCRDHLKGGKENLIRKKIGTKICQESCRLTMTCDPSLRPDEISIPQTIWGMLGFPEKVVLVRYPSISILNLTIHKVIPYRADSNNFAITARAPPTICAGHNMDFDGDAGSIKALSRLAGYELTILISPKYNFMVDGRMRVNFSSDAKLGLGFDNHNNPKHLLLEKWLKNKYIATGNSIECYELFNELEDDGRAKSIVCQGVDDSKLDEYISSKSTKLTIAHQIAIQQLSKGLDVDAFTKSCKDARMGIADTPLNASDNGLTVSTAFILLKSIKHAYDYTLRTAEGKLVTFWSFDFCCNRPKPIQWSIPPIDNPHFENFTPFHKNVILEDVELKPLNHPIFDKLIGEYIIVKKIKTNLPLNLYGRLYFSIWMERLGLMLNTPYLVFFKSIDGAWSSYVFEFLR